MPSVQSVPPCTLRAPSHRPHVSSRLPPPPVALHVLGATWQTASAFNQPLNLDTSSVTSSTEGMFQVRIPARVPCPVSSRFLRACCEHRHTASTARALATSTPGSPSTCLGATRQGASAFNQPLSLVTSSFTDMNNMFYVRTPAHVLCPVSSRFRRARCVHRHTAPDRPSTPHHPQCPLCASVQLGSWRTRSTSR